MVNWLVSYLVSWLKNARESKEVGGTVRTISSFTN